ncbi:MAG: adenine nucleotide alpha hydrolase family protein [Nitrospirae bacterium]|nr:MAG: adenine nucleotide alpha hydrolase family protein [Nitrospirota bacterium]
MKCRVCKSKAVISLPRHNSAFCKEHFIEFFRAQVKKAIKEFRMFTPEDRILLCVSGGKDSLSLWHCLTELGYKADGLYIDLGIDGYSEQSRQLTEDMSKALQRKLIIIDLKKDYAPVPVLAKTVRKSPCSVCGTVKRYFFNRVAIEGGYTVVATGHNLDDEAARLLGNVLRWQVDYLAKQHPSLEEEHGLKKKVKPLCRLTEQEVAGYAFLNRIRYILQECPMSRDATSLIYKKALNLIETESPGTKHYFYQEFLKKKETLGLIPEKTTNQGLCSHCGMPTFSETCSFCRMMEKAKKTSQKIQI